MSKPLKDAAATVAYDIAERVTFWRKSWPLVFGELVAVYIIVRVVAT